MQPPKAPIRPGGHDGPAAWPYAMLDGGWGDTHLATQKWARLHHSPVVMCVSEGKQIVNGHMYMCFRHESQLPAIAKIS